MEVTYMFEVGDNIVYPNHGAGTIVDLEEKEILGETKQYYIMKLPIGEMRVMIPKGNAEEIGLRDIINEDIVPKVYQVLAQDQSEMSQNWNRRYRANSEKIKTGDIFEVAEVVRNLNIRDIVKGLSTGEKKMLSNSRQILISELVLAEDKSEEEVREKIDQIFEEQDFDEE
jgi:CarD family transcriptional regulator